MQLQHGTDAGCGHRIDGGRNAVLRLPGNLYAWYWTVHIRYSATGDTAATFRFGNGTHTLPVEQGAHDYYFLIEGGASDVVELSLADPTVTLCTNEITIGHLKPAT